MLRDYVRYDYVWYDYVIMRGFFSSSSVMDGSDTICKKYFPPFSNPPLISNKETPTHQRSSDKRFIPTRHKNKLISALTKHGGNNMRP